MPAQPDLSKLSDEDLSALASGDLTKVSDKGLHQLSNVQDESDFSKITPTQTFLSSLSPKGLISRMYGAKEALPVALNEGLSAGADKYNKEKEYAQNFLEASSRLNPKSAVAGEVTGALLPATITGGGALATEVPTYATTAEGLMAQNPGLLAKAGNIAGNIVAGAKSALPSIGKGLAFGAGNLLVRKASDLLGFNSNEKNNH